MADTDDIKPTHPIWPSRPLDPRERSRRPPEKERDKDEPSDKKRRPHDGHKGQNVDDYA